MLPTEFLDNWLAMGSRAWEGHWWRPFKVTTSM